MHHWEAWAVPGAAPGVEGLRITTDSLLPFDNSSLLRVTLGREGFEFEDRDRAIVLLLLPYPGPEVLQLFSQCLVSGIPVTLTEIDFPNKQQRTWLAGSRNT